MRRWLKRFLGAGIVAGVAYAIWRVLDERSRASDLTWTAQPFPSPPRPEIREAPVETPDETSTAVAAEPVLSGSDDAWIEPDGDACPATHPVKGKLASGIFHEPGGQMYDRTTPDRCYRDADAAVADGLRASKR